MLDFHSKEIKASRFTEYIYKPNEYGFLLPFIHTIEVGSKLNKSWFISDSNIYLKQFSRENIS